MLGSHHHACSTYLSSIPPPSLTHPPLLPVLPTPVGLRVVRIAAKSRESTPSSVDHLTLHSMVKNLDGPDKTDLRKYQTLKDELGELTAQDASRYRQLRTAAEKEILQAADVICCTCVGAGDPRLSNFRFRQLLIDESTQAMEAECFIPIGTA